MSCQCVIYKGVGLQTLDVQDGDTLCSVLEKLNAIVRTLALSQPVPTFVHRTCVTTATQAVTATVIRRNGVTQIASATTYPNVATLLAFLATLEPTWVMDSSYKLLNYSADVWEITTTC